MTGTHPPSAAGSAGQQRSFLEKCRAEAAPNGPGQLRGSGAATRARVPSDPVATPPAPDLPQRDRGNKSTGNTGQHPLLPRCPGGETIPCLGPSSEDAVYTLHERLAIAADLGMPTSEGSPAWDTAVREARRVASGLPANERSETLDAALAAFAGLGGLRLVAVEDDASALAPALEASPSMGVTQAPSAEPRGSGGH